MQSAAARGSTPRTAAKPCRFGLIAGLALQLSGTVDAVSIGVSGAVADGRSPIGQIFSRDGKERSR
jgi:hypothetical protein